MLGFLVSGSAGAANMYVYICIYMYTCVIVVCFTTVLLRLCPSKIVPGRRYHHPPPIYTCVEVLRGSYTAPRAPSLLPHLIDNNFYHSRHIRHHDLVKLAVQLRSIDRSISVYGKQRSRTGGVRGARTCTWEEREGRNGLVAVS